MSETTPPQRPRLRPHRLAGRLLMIVLEGVSALIGIVLVAIILLALRLEWGPIEVDFLTPMLTTVIEAAIPPLNVTIGRTSVNWGPGRGTVDLIASDTKITDPVGGQVLALPRLAVSLSLPALLLHGQPAPTRMTLVGPRVRIVRRRDGQVDVGLGSVTDQPDADQTGAPLAALLHALSGTPRSDEPLGMLNELAVERASATVEDQEAGVRWRLDEGAVTLKRLRTGFDAAVAGQFRLGDAVVHARGLLKFDEARHRLAFDTQLDGIDPSRAAAALPADLASSGAVHLAVAVRIEGRIDTATMKLDTVAVGASAGPGALVDRHFAGGRLALRRVELAARYDPALGQLDLGRLLVDLGGPQIEVKGLALGLDPALILGQTTGHRATLIGRVDLHGLPLDRFAAVWPIGIATDARAWVTEHLSVGVATSGTVQALASLDPGAAQPLLPQSFAGTLAIDNASVDFLEGLPKIEGADGVLTMAPDRLALNLTRGTLNGLTLPQGTVVIDDFNAAYERITIDIGLRGKVSDVLSVLDVKRLQYAKAVGLVPDEIGGAIDGTLHFRFRLKKDLPFSEVEYGAQAQVADLAIPHAAFGRDLTAGNLKLDLDGIHLVLDGTAALDQVPTTLVWSERLTGTVGPKSRLHAKAILDDHARQRFDLDPIPEILHGPEAATVVYTELDHHSATAEVSLDLADATLTLDQIGWQKPMGTPGRASFLVGLEDGHVTRLDKIDLHAGGLDLAGQMAFHDGSLTKAEINSLRLDQTDATGTVTHAADGAWQVSLRGSTIDATGFMKHLIADRHRPDTTPGPVIALDLASDRLILGPQRVLRSVVINGAIAHHAVAAGSLSAKLGESGSLTARLDRVESGGRFRLTTDDFGTFFQVAGIADNIAGGSLTVSGASTLEGDARRFTGRAQGENYRLLRMPFMTRLLSLASFQTVSSLMAGTGIPFTTLKADFALKSGRLEIQHGRAYGGAIGVNAEGWFDLNSATIALSGTLVPAYYLNSALGGVPVLGDLLLGGEGQGLFGANVRVSGALAEPAISINPLSALAPGFLRNLFLFDAPGGDQKDGDDKAP